MQKIITLIAILIVQVGFSQWSYHSSFPKTESIIDLTIGQTGNVYVLTSDRQIYSSSNNGNTWTPFIETPLFLNVLQIKASKISNRLFVKTNCCGVAYTDNLGANWSWDNLFTNTISGLGLSPKGIDVFQSKAVAVAGRFVGNLGFVKELYISTNNGANSTWNLAHTFAPLENSLRNVFLLDNNLIFTSFNLLQSSPSGTSTMQKSTDVGATFTNVSFFNDMEQVDLLITSSQTIYCATNTSTHGEIHRSDDLGNTWTTITPPTTTTKINKIAYDNVNNLLYAITEDGMYRKTNSGNWVSISSESDLITIAINENQDILTGGLVIVGVQKSTTNPINFNTIEIGGNFSPEWVRISENVILMGNANNPIISKTDISTPNAWQHTAIQNKALSAEAISFGATVGSFGAQVKNNGDITVSGNNYIANLSTDLNFNIIADEDLGVPLAPILNPAFIPQRLKLSNNDEILIKQLNANYIDTSLNGTTWNILNPVATQPTKIIEDFCAGNDNYYILTSDFSQTFGYEVHYSTNGTTWNSIPLPNGRAGKNVFIDKLDNLYLLATGPLTLYRLDLANEQWITTNLSLHNDPNTYFELAFDNNNNMYAINFRTTTTTSTSQGIAYSDDQGVSWTSESFPIISGNTVYLESLGFDDDGILYAKSSNNNNNEPLILKGVYSFKSTLNTSEFNLSPINIYPNPISTYFNLDVKEGGSYAIFDSLGRKILSGNVIEGITTIHFPKNIVNGIYFLNVKTATNFFSEKIIYKGY